jgi:hypothetical protein
MRHSTKVDSTGFGVQHPGLARVLMAMSAPRSQSCNLAAFSGAADVGTLSTRRTYSYTAAIAMGALLWAGGIVSYGGHSLPQERAPKLFRYCGGKCLCDGGIANAEIMSRVCPEGWEGAYSVAREKLRRQHRLRRKRLRKQLQANPPSPPPAAGPNV